MGATAVISSSASSSVAGVSATVTSLLSPVGMGIGGIAVALTLVYVLAHLDVLSARENPDPQLRQTLVAMAIPLGLTFAGIVAFQVTALA